jgi:hypothetical protein
LRLISLDPRWRAVRQRGCRKPSSPSPSHNAAGSRGGSGRGLLDAERDGT